LEPLVVAVCLLDLKEPKKQTSSVLKYFIFRVYFQCDSKSRLFLCAAYSEVFYCYDVKPETSYSRKIIIQEFHARFNKSGSVRITVTLTGVRVTVVALEIQ